MKLVVTGCWPSFQSPNFNDINCDVVDDQDNVVKEVGFIAFPGDANDLHNMPCDEEGNLIQA